MSLIMAFSRYQPLPSLFLALFLYLWLRQSVSHCILQSGEIGQIDRHLAFHVKKCGGVQRLSWPIQLSTFCGGERNVFSLTNAAYQVSASYCLLVL